MPKWHILGVMCSVPPYYNGGNTYQFTLTHESLLPLAS